MAASQGQATRRDFSVMGLAGLSLLMAASSPARAAELLSEQRARQALDPWYDAIFSGDPAAVAGVLAPEYQILRADGTAHDKEAYLQALPKHNTRATFSDIVATGDDHIMVIRYLIESDQVADGKAVRGTSPRLSVFRREGDRWLLSAHANFAPVK